MRENLFVSVSHGSYEKLRPDETLKLRKFGSAMQYNPELKTPSFKFFNTEVRYIERIDTNKYHI